MSLISSYDDLSNSSPRKDVVRVLQAIVDASPAALTTPQREKLAQKVLDDVQSCVVNNGKGGGRLTKGDLQIALLAVKTLGRIPHVSKILAQENNLATLLNIAKSLESSDAKASHEALRCVANALLLIAEGRTIWVDVHGADYCVDLLESTDSPAVIFLASRMLFLVTVSSSSPIVTTLFKTGRNSTPNSPTPIYDMRATLTSGSSKPQEKDIVEVIGNRLELLLNATRKNAFMSKEGMTDLLKFTFNLLVHWPKMADMLDDAPKDKKKGKDKVGKKTDASSEDTKVMGEIWTERLDDILPPLLRVFLGLPTTSPSPLAPPLTHIIHGLLTIPVQGKYYRVWFPELAAPQGSSGSNASSRIPSSNSSPSNRAISPLPPTSRSGSPSAATKEKEPKEKEKDSRGPLDRALSRLPRISLSSDRSSWYGRSPSPTPNPVSLPRKSTSSPSSNSFPLQPRVLVRAAELLDSALAHYMPGAVDSDDKSVREKCKKEDVQLDDVLSPLVVLLTRLCEASEECRKFMRMRILPPDLDRTSPLEERADTLGRCIRLLGSVHHSRTKIAVGELLLAICDSDPQTLSLQVGYGHVAGFLYNKGIMAPPQATQSASITEVPDTDVVNPITGMIKQDKSPLPEMTQEEKEREAEKLFVLFDRLERAGGGENPVRRALREGKLEKYQEQQNANNRSDDE